MIPQQTFESYPVFGDNATKVKPDDVKYAAGFQQADVLPAEWMNWAWSKNSKGISDANAGLSSIEAEIINVLTSRGETPSANNSNQLLTVLNKIKAEAALAAHPVGSLYWTSSTENPATTFGGGTWTQIKDKFVLAAGDTYTNGNTGGAATVTLTTDQIPSHNHSFTPSGTVASHTHSIGAHSHGLNSHTHTVGAHSHGLNEHTHSFTPSGTVQKHSHGLNSHTHSFTPSGTIGSGGSHYHFQWSANDPNTTTSPTITKVVNTVQNVNYNTADAYQSNRFPVPIPYSSNTSYTRQWIDAQGNPQSFDVGRGGYIDGCAVAGSWSGYHNHSFTGTAGTTGQSSGNTTEIQPTFTGTAGTTGKATGSTANSTAFNTGTATGSTANSTAFDSGTAQPSFTGTAGTTGSKGGGGAHNNMPPYIVKYCWERTA